MATIHGQPKAGQYAKSRALAEINRIFTLCLTVMALAAISLGFSVGIQLAWRNDWVNRIAHFPIWIQLCIEIAVMISCLISVKLLDKPINQRMRERLMWLRGGQAEGYVASFLHEMPNTWHVFHNIQLQDHSDIDHVLIGPGGVFCISTKSHRGMYSIASDGTYLLNGREIDHVQAAKRMAMELRDRMAGIMGQVPWIQAVLIAPFAFVDFPTCQQRIWVLHEDNLPHMFEDAPQILNAAEIKRCVLAMNMIPEHGRRYGMNAAICKMLNLKY